MKKYMITDTHFGVRQNSIVWLKSQMKFFYDQFIPNIKKEKEIVNIYHLGDLFDSRSSINPFVASQVRQLFEDLAALENVNLIVVLGGNHDYYSPNDSTTDSINLVLRGIKKVEIITNGTSSYWDEDLDEYDAFIPWNDYFNINYLETSISLKGTKRVFIHNDLDNIEPEYRQLFKKYDVDVYSGHIHIPSDYGKLHNLGSCFALNFADTNQDRGYYVMNGDGSNLTFYPNIQSIKFIRLYNKEIFSRIDFNTNDYIELYIDQDKLSSDGYQAQIKWFNEKYKNIVVVPVTKTSCNESVSDFESYNIESICKESIPENLADKFKVVLERINDI